VALLNTNLAGPALARWSNAAATSISSYLM
jgi:hypothetical protein